MSTLLPDRVDVYRLAKEQVTLDGRIELEAMPRFLECIDHIEGDAQAWFEFATTDTGLNSVTVSIKAPVGLVCQRCLEVMVLNMDIKSQFIFVSSEKQIENIPDQYEGVVVEELPYSLWSLVEDELILAIPIIPMHEQDQCPASDTVKQIYSPAEAEEIKENPFAVLKQLQKTVSKE